MAVELHYAVVNSALALGLGIVIFVMSMGAAMALIMWYAALGRGLNMDRLGVLAAVAVTLSQIAYAVAYYVLQGKLLYVLLIDTVRSCSGALLACAALFLFTPALLCLMLGLARRLPWLRAALLLCSPLVLGAALMLLPFLLYGVIDACCGQASASTVFDALPAVVAMATGGFAILAPFAAVYSVLDGSLLDGLKELFLLFALMLPAQLIYIYVVARFALEAVSARRRRVD